MPTSLSSVSRPFGIDESMVEAMRLVSWNAANKRFPGVLKRQIKGLGDISMRSATVQESFLTYIAHQEPCIPLWISFGKTHHNGYDFEASIYRYGEGRYDDDYYIVVLHSLGSNCPSDLKAFLPAIIVPRYLTTVPSASSSIHSTWVIWDNGIRRTNLKVAGQISPHHIAQNQLLIPGADHATAQQHDFADTLQSPFYYDTEPQLDNSRIITLRYRRGPDLPARLTAQQPENSDKQNREKRLGLWSPQTSRKKPNVYGTMEKDQPEDTSTDTDVQFAQTPRGTDLLSDNRNPVSSDHFPADFDSNLKADNRATLHAATENIILSGVTAQSRQNEVYFHFRHRDSTDVVRKQTLANITCSNDIFNHARSGRNPILGFGMKMLSVSVDGGTPWNIMKNIDDDFKDVIDEIESHKRTSNEDIIVAIMPPNV